MAAPSSSAFPRDYSWVGSCINSFQACSAFTRVTTCRLAKSPYATLYTGGSGSFVASAAPIATGWSDPVPGWVFSPAVVQCLSRRTEVARLGQTTQARRDQLKSPVLTTASALNKKHILQRKFLLCSRQ
jgi:hypothetical protein